MNDTTELRRLAEAVKTARAALVGHICGYKDEVSACQSSLHDDMLAANRNYNSASPPDVVLALLDEIERLRTRLDGEVAANHRLADDRASVRGWANKLYAQLSRATDYIGHLVSMLPEDVRDNTVWMECREALGLSQTGQI